MASRMLIGAQQTAADKECTATVSRNYMKAFENAVVDVVNETGATYSDVVLAMMKSLKRENKQYMARVSTLVVSQLYNADDESGDEQCSGQSGPIGSRGRLAVAHLDVPQAMRQVSPPVSVSRRLVEHDAPSPSPSQVRQQTSRQVVTPGITQADCIYTGSRKMMVNLLVGNDPDSSNNTYNRLFYVLSVNGKAKIKLPPSKFSALDNVDATTLTECFKAINNFKQAAQAAEYVLGDSDVYPVKV